MNDKKTVHLTLENHEYLKKLAYLDNSTIELELNQIISNKRKEEGINIYVARRD